MPDFTFQPGQMVVNLSQSRDMTAGRAYRVHGSYDGHAGSGAPQEWCRVADNTGRVIGYDPDRFVAASSEGLTPNPVACAAALRSRLSLGQLLGEFRAGESFAVIRSKLRALFDDATAIVAETAEEPARNQITFTDQSASLPPRVGRGVQLKVLVGVGLTPIGWMRYSLDEDYTLLLDDEVTPLNALNYEDAMTLVRAIVLAKSGGDPEALDFWAAMRAPLDLAA